MPTDDAAIPAVQPVACYSHNSTLPPQASYHRRMGKAGSNSLWASKTSNANRWKAEEQRKDRILLQVSNNSKHAMHFQTKPTPPPPTTLSISNTTTSTFTSTTSTFTSTPTTSMSTSNASPTTASPRATKWIVEKRSRHHFFQTLAVPRSTSFSTDSKIDPTSYELLRAKNIIGGGNTYQAGWTKDQFEAIERLEQRVHRSRHAAGLPDSDDSDSDDSNNSEDDEEELSFQKLQNQTKLKLMKEKTMGLNNAPDFLVHHKMMIKAGSYSNKGRSLKQSARSYELQHKINACRHYIHTIELNKIVRPALSRHARAKIRRERKEKLFVIIMLVTRTAMMEENLLQRIEDQKLYLLRKISAMKMQKWYKRIIAGKSDEKKVKALIVINRFVQQCRHGFRLKTLRKNSDILSDFLTNHAQQNVTTLIKKFRDKIIKGQRCWKSYTTITKGRMLLLQKLWDLEEQRLHDGEQARKDREEQEQLEFEAGLINDKSTLGQRGSDIAARVISATQRRHRQNNTGPGSDTTKITTATKKQNSNSNNKEKNLAMKLLSQRTKRVLQSTKFHLLQQVKTQDHLRATRSIRHQMLKTLLRNKRLAYQKTLVKTVSRLIAKRQTTVQLNIEDVRRFLHSGTNAEVKRQEKADNLKHRVNTEDEKPQGVFLLLRSLEHNEIRNLVARGIKLSTGFVVNVNEEQIQSGGGDGGGGGRTARSSKHTSRSRSRSRSKSTR